YALDRSHGASVSRGEVTADTADFTANLPVDNSIRNYATPIPQLITAVNAVFQEYCLFKQETNSPRFFEVDRQKYLQANADEIQEFTDAVRREEILALLTANGYKGGLKTDQTVPPAPLAQRLRSKFKRVATSSPTTGAWLLLSRTAGVTPPADNSFEFAELDDAIDYARNISRGNLSGETGQAELLSARALPSPPGGVNGNHSSAKLKQTLGSVTPLPLRRMVHERTNQQKLATLLRTKERFRAQREAGVLRDSPPGVNLVAYIRADMGLGTAARGMAAAFEAAGIPFNVINLEHGNEASQTDHSWAHKEVRQSAYDVTLVCVNPDNSFNLRTQVPAEILGDRYVIANWYWELPELPDAWLSEFEYVDEVWAPSNFIEDAVASKATVPLVRVPPVVQLGHGHRLSRSELGLPEHEFLFLAMFDSRSVLERKNPLGVVRAFKRAFEGKDKAVGLVLKFLENTDWTQPVLQQVKREIDECENVFVLERLMSRAELTSLLDACDCFVSLHRSEGFGLVPAEAMSLGKPAIITNWSGNTDYMKPDNSVAIDYQLVRLDRDYGPYQSGQQWAEPDLEQAAHWMKRFVADPELAKQIGSRGQQTIHSQFSPEAVGKIIQSRLEQIRAETIGLRQ
ncbi:MAG TPA: glycosyltransferase family 4 protein, partial [Pyrinomonadaceae bacterium]